MKKDPSVLIEHILESITLINNYVQGQTLSDFIISKVTQDAVIRRLQIIGEAVKNLPAEFTEQHKEIPWRKISGLRNILTHEYFGVDLNLTWNVIKNDLPILEKQIESLI